MKKESVIISSIAGFFRFIGAKFSESFFGSVICGSGRKRKDGVFSYLASRFKLKQRITVPFKRAVARAADRSFFLKKLNSVTAHFPDLQVKNIGSASFAFGLSIVISYLVRRFALGRTDADFFELYFGVIACIIGAVTSSTQKTVGKAIFESKILSFVLFSVLGLKKTPLRGTDEPWGRGDTAFAIGAGFGVLSALTSPIFTALAILIVLFGYTVLVSPESGVPAVILMLPFLSENALALICGYISLSWIIKIARGKRTLYFSLLDISVAAFAFVLLTGGIITISPDKSFVYSLRCISHTSAFFLTVNLMRSSERISKCVNSFIFVLSVSLVIGISELVTEMFFQNSAIAAEITSALSPIFADRASVNNIILLTLPLVSVAISSTRSRDSKWGLSILALLSLFFLALSAPSVFTVAAAASLAMLALTCGRKATAPMLAALLLLAVFVLSVLPIASEMIGFREFSNKGAETVRLSERLPIDAILGGVGLGGDAAEISYPLLTDTNIPSSVGFANTMLLSVGVFGIIVFIIAILAFVRHFAASRVHSLSDDRRLSLTSAAGFASVTAFMILAFGSSVDITEKTFLQFWITVGLSSAAIRTAISERIPERQEGISLELDIESLSVGTDKTDKEDT